MPFADSLYTDIVNECLSHGAQLVVVTKTQPIEKIMPFYHAGQRVFAENRVRELLTKKEQMPPDCQWHLIGHLQTNKVRDILPHVSLIHSLDRMNLWEIINAECERNGTQVSCLLEVKVATEETKYGWDPKELDDILRNQIHIRFPNIILKGVMGMTTLTDNEDVIRKEMKEIAEIYHQLKASYFEKNDSFSILSMGMSGDYKIALQEGSTMVRIGSLLFS